MADGAAEPGAIAETLARLAQAQGAPRVATAGPATEAPTDLPLKTPRTETPTWIRVGGRVARRNAIAAVFWPTPAGEPSAVFAGNGLGFSIGGDERNHVFAAGSDETQGESLAELQAQPETREVFIVGAAQIGPVARVVEAADGSPNLRVLRPELFEGAATPGEAERRAKRLALAPLILDGTLSGYGAGVDPNAFAGAEGFPIAEPLDGSVVTPIPSDDDQALTRWAEGRDRPLSDLGGLQSDPGFDPADPALVGVQILEVGPPDGELNETNAWAFLDRARLPHGDTASRGRHPSRTRATQHLTAR